MTADSLDALLDVLSGGLDPIKPEGESTCRACGEHITCLLGDWTDDDGTTACCGDMSAPYVPHKPGEAGQ